MEVETRVEELEMRLIASSGDGRSVAFRALAAAKAGEAKTAAALLHQAEDDLGRAHKYQTELLQLEAQSGDVPMSMLLAHAQDHLMSSILAQELIAELVEVYGRMKGEA